MYKLARLSDYLQRPLNHSFSILHSQFCVLLVFVGDSLGRLPKHVRFHSTMGESSCCCCFYFSSLPIFVFIMFFFLLLLLYRAMRSCWIKVIFFCLSFSTLSIFAQHFLQFSAYLLLLVVGKYCCCFQQHRGFSLQYGPAHILIYRNARQER